MATILIKFDRRDCTTGIAECAEAIKADFPDSALINKIMIFIGNTTLVRVQRWLLNENFNLDELEVSVVDPD